MKKIKDALTKLSGSDEFAQQFLTLIDEHVADEKKAIKENYDTKVKEMKGVCVKAVSEEKARLAKKVETYLQSVSDRVAKSRSKQLAMEESESANKLRQVATILEGLDIKTVDDANGQLKAAKRRYSLLESRLKELTQGNRDLESKLAKTNDIAAKSIRKVRLYEQQLEEAKKGQVVESKDESKDSKGKVVIESTDKKTAKKPALDKVKRAPSKIVTEAKQQATLSIEDIAKSMDE